jgi:hypothetical protein
VLLKENAFRQGFGHKAQFQVTQVGFHRTTPFRKKQVRVERSPQRSSKIREKTSKKLPPLTGARASASRYHPDSAAGATLHCLLRRLTATASCDAHGRRFTFAAPRRVRLSLYRLAATAGSLKQGVSLLLLFTAFNSKTAPIRQPNAGKVKGLDGWKRQTPSIFGQTRLGLGRSNSKRSCFTFNRQTGHGK